MFQDGGAFENAVTATMADAGDEIFGRTERAGTLRINRSYSGFVDNIFNYHTDKHWDHPDLHCLLEKLRILQILSDGQERTAREIALAMESKFGYGFSGNDNGKTTLGILLYGDFIDIQPVGGRVVFSIKDKARAVTNRLIERQVYLEHVFHKTLFPAQLVEHLRDVARHRDRDAWIVSSIRNCFIFLTYLRFVEGNPASGKQVAGEYLIYPRIQVALRASVGRILRQDYLERRSSSQETWFVTRVESEIRKTIALWEQSGLVRNGGHAA
jgi:hypothetical protein